MTPDIIAQTDFFFWNNFTGLYTDTMNEFEGETKTLQDIIYIMLERHRKAGSVIITMYPLDNSKNTEAHIVDR